jgi:F-type H+-transporting ATPase subunit a
MEISPDQTIFWQYGPIKLNATIIFSWAVMALLVFISWAVTRRLSTGPHISRWQIALESLVSFIRDQIRGVTGQRPENYLPFVGSLFLFISLSNFLSFIPRYHPPTGSLSTTAALALCVLVASPIYGISQSGLGGYLKHYVTPSWFMFPFKVLSEISRTVALAIRLFGNVMSGAMIAAILLLVLPLFVPVVLRGLELLIGQVQAFIFAVLATVYISSGVRAHREEAGKDETHGKNDKGKDDG